MSGLGPVAAAGIGAEAFWQGLLAGRGQAAPRRFETAGVAWGEFPVHAVDDGDLPEIEPVPAGSLKLADVAADRELRLSVIALALAIADARLPPGCLPRAGLVLTYEAPGIDRLLTGIFADFLKLRRGEALADRSGDERAPEAARPEEAAFFEAIYLRHRQAVYESQSFMHLHLAARLFGLHGPALFVNNACASGLYALEAAAAMIRSGSCDTALVAAAEAALLPTKHRWFQEAQVLSAKGSLRPFDRDRDGLVLGEGACGLVLESEQAARARGASPYARYLGGSFVQEAWKVAVPNLTQPWYEETLRRACAAARVEPEDIDLLNPHGAGTALGDLQEARGLTAVYGEWPERPRITALKGAVGHTLGASAALETAASLLALKHQTIPPSIGFQSPDPKLKIKLVERPQPTPLRAVLKMACGFAGFLGGAVFQKTGDSH